MIDHDLRCSCAFSDASFVYCIFVILKFLLLSFQAITVGLNVVREICLRMPLVKFKTFWNFVLDLNFLLIHKD